MSLSRQRGTALVLVLWSIVMLALMAGGYAYHVHTEMSIVQLARDRAEARPIAEAALAFTAARLVTEESVDIPEAELVPLNGLPWSWSFGGRDVVVRVTNAAGRVDLNHADEAQLQNLLRLAGVEEPVALAASLMEFRSGIGSQRFLGMQPVKGGIPRGIGDLSFATSEELGQVDGFHRNLVRTLLPVVTTFGARNVNPDFAPVELIALAVGEHTENVESVVAAGNEGAAPLLTDLRTGQSRSNAYHIGVEVHRGGGPPVRFNAVIELHRGARGLFKVLEWRE